MCKVYAVGWHKGGVTKTTTVLNLATALALTGKKVLCADLDPQGSLTICPGVQNPDKLTHTVYSLLNAAILDIPSSSLIILAKFYKTSVEYLLGLSKLKMPYEKE